MYVVIDTNLWVAAFLAGRNQTDLVFDKVQELSAKLVYSNWQIREFVHTLSYERIQKKYSRKNGASD